MYGFMVSDLENNILSGLVLVLVVVFIFIGGRSAFFVALAIPFSMMITFSILSGLDVTLNIVVLFSLILALGMLVDNGIVIVENIYRHIQEGKSRLEAARLGTDEVAWPVTTSTITTLGAFVPLLFWPDIMGEFMVYLPETVIIALTASLFVALVINPVLSAKYQTAKPKDPVTQSGEERSAQSEAHVQEVLVWSLDHRLVVIAAAFALLVSSITAFALFGKGTEFFPDTEPRRAFVDIEAAEGTNLDASDKLVGQVEKVVANYPDIRYVIANIGTAEASPFSSLGGVGTHLSRVTLDFLDMHDRSRPSSGIVNEVRGTLTGSDEGC
jgi:multidrug efflux pump